MAYLNKIQLIGRLTAEPDAPRVLPNSGATVVKFRLAVGRSRKDANGNWENDPNPLYLDCETFSYTDSKRDLAGIVSSYVKKGDQIYVEGRLNLDQWEDPEGNKRQKHKMVVDNVEFLGGNGGETKAEQPAPQQQQEKPVKGKGRPAKAKNADDVGDGGDIPF